MTIAVERALSLLDLFVESRPEIGLSDAARLSGHDKATVYRLLSTLRAADLIEQDPTSRLYRIGPAVLRLAHVREATFPVVSVAQPVVDRLAEATGETAHFSLYSGKALVVMAARESSRPNHVAIRASETLPFHATAAGLAFLAFAAADLREAVLATPLEAFTRHTPTSPAGIAAALALTRRNGYAIVDKSYDEDVYGVAFPVIGRGGSTAIGALAVASPSHRMTDNLRSLVLLETQAAVKDLSQRLGNFAAR